MTDRQREIRFGLAALFGIIAVAGAAEWLAASREAAIAGRRVDWEGLVRSAGADDLGVQTFRPGARFGKIRFNQLGFRGPEIAARPAANNIRIAFLGDSKMFAGEVAEPRAMPAQTAKILHQRFPACQFDYVNIAGPGYTLTDLTHLVERQGKSLRPDVAVILAGSATDLVMAPSVRIASERAEDAKQPAAAPSPIAALLENSVALGLIERELKLISPVMPTSGAAQQSLAELSARQRAMLGDLATALGSTPALTLAYRSRDGMVDGLLAPWLAARRMRKFFPGMPPEKAKALNALVVTEMQRQSARSGWHFIDPLAEIVAGDHYFLDRTHFSPEGHAFVARAVASEVASMIEPDCRIRR
jgi:lysophospholipase L1-like esterase